LLAVSPLSALEVDLRLTVPLALRAQFEIRGFTALLGRSGAGKTSLLRALAGLIPAVGTPWAGMAAEARPVGYLPQGSALFPHLTVLGNAAFALRGPDRLGQARALLDDFGVGHLVDRPAAKISGGEAQRVALARALGRAPELLLLDEPLAALDTATRDIVLAQLIETIDEKRVPALAATHDPAIAALADWLVLLSDGLVIRQGTPRELFNDPRSVAAARLLGYQNFWVEDGVMHTVRADRIELATAGRVAEIVAVREQGELVRLTCLAPEPFTVLVGDAEAGDFTAGQMVHLRFPAAARKILAG
jgi:molybdate transport system ATP-binding protein